VIICHVAVAVVAAAVAVAVARQQHGHKQSQLQLQFAENATTQNSIKETHCSRIASGHDTLH